MPLVVISFDFSFLSKTGKYYKLSSGPYVEFDEADKKCKDLGARLPVLDSQDTIDVIRNYMKIKEFPPGDIRRVWLGLYRVNVKINCSRLVWADKKMAFKYSASSMLSVWESTELDSSIR